MTSKSRSRREMQVAHVLDASDLKIGCYSRNTLTLWLFL
jgi:hypothetical protein